MKKLVVFSFTLLYAGTYYYTVGDLNTYLSNYDYWFSNN